MKSIPCRSFLAWAFLALTMTFLIENSHSLHCYTCTKTQHCKVEKCLGYLTSLGLGSHPTCVTVLKEKTTFMRLCTIGDNWDDLTGGSGTCEQVTLSKVAEVKEFDTAVQTAKSGGKINATEVEALKTQGFETMRADSAEEVKVCSCTHPTCTTHHSKDTDNLENYNHHPHPTTENGYDGATTLLGSGCDKMIIFLAVMMCIVP